MNTLSLHQKKYDLNKRCCSLDSCQKELPYNKRHNLYCNTSCRTIANNLKRGPRSEETKNRISSSVKANPSGIVAEIKNGRSIEGINRVERTTKQCKICNSIFEHRITESRTFCSDGCRRQNSGGLRRGSGRSKHGWYKGFYLDSTYELAFAIYCIDHNIQFERNHNYWLYEHQGKIKKYYPDFIIQGVLVEIKGYYNELVDIKLEAVDQPIIVLYNKDLTDIFKYVVGKTGYKLEDLHQLYE